MKLSPDLTRYVVRAGIVAIGALLAVLDRRWIGLRVFAVLLVTGIVGGLIITKVSPATAFGRGATLIRR
jgi:hypothetical protein